MQDNIPYLSKYDIEKRVKKLTFDYHRNTHQRSSENFDPFEIIEYLGYSFDFSSSGPFSDPDFLGGLYVDDKKVVFNESLENNEGRLNFTAAHEIGHICLHVPLLNINNSNILCRTDEGLFGNQKDRKEIQADIFASYFLMGTDKVRNSYFAVKKKPVNVRRWILKDIIKPTSPRQKAINITKKVKIAGQFDKVSTLAMTNRLIGLGLIRGISYQSYKNNKRKRK